MSAHLHHYKDGVCADPRAIGGPCGEPQVYKAQGGKPLRFTDVLVEEDDLRTLVTLARRQTFALVAASQYDDLFDRVESLLGLDADS